MYIEPIRRSRLIYTSPTNSTKIFEFAKVAKIKGKIQPVTPVTLEKPVNLPNCNFVWIDSLTTDKNGNFLFTCPYKTDSLPALIIADKDTFRINVSNEAVLNGDTLILTF